MKPKDTKGAIEQLILDIQYNEWYCLQGDSDSELKDWEKNLILIGLRKLLLDEICKQCAREVRQEMGMKQIIDWSEE